MMNNFSRRTFLKSLSALATGIAAGLRGVRVPEHVPDGMVLVQETSLDKLDGPLPSGIASTFRVTGEQIHVGDLVYMTSEGAVRAWQPNEQVVGVVIETASGNDVQYALVMTRGDLS